METVQGIALFSFSLQQINLALLKLLTLSGAGRQRDVLSFVKSYRNILPPAETVQLLEESANLVALSFFHLRMGHWDTAVTLMKDLIDGVRVDATAEQECLNVAHVVDVVKK